MLHNYSHLAHVSNLAARCNDLENGMDIPEHIRRLSQAPLVLEIWQYLDEVLADILAEAILIQQIPAPTFRELVRANHVLSRFGACNLADTGIDALNNAYGRMPGLDSSAPALLISAHTDTVFGEGVDLKVNRTEDGRIHGPGLGDNSLGVAGLIALADILRQFRIQPRMDIWFLANSREEGLGDLGGIRAFYEAHCAHLGSAVVLEGLALGQIYTSGIAVRRLHIQCHAEGGHSWQHFGRPSAIHSLVRLGARLTALEVPRTPRTTFNIGLIQGGQSINSLAAEAGFHLDMRSETSDALATLEAQVMDILAECRASEPVEFEVTVVGDRPAGSVSIDHDLVRTAQAVLHSLDITPSFKTGSTDANLLLSRGLPTVTIGLTRGDNAHRLDEYIEVEPLRVGLQQIILLALALSGWQPEAG